MLTAAGPKLLEYNVRFGDPECQALMMRLQERPRAGADGGARRRPRHGRSALARRGGDLRRDGGQGLSRRPAARQRDPRPRRGRTATRTSRSSTPAPGATATASSPMAAACSASPRSAPTSPRPATAPIARSTGSTGPAASAAGISERGDCAGRTPSRQVWQIAIGPAWCLLVDRKCRSRRTPDLDVGRLGGRSFGERESRAAARLRKR